MNGLPTRNINIISISVFLLLNCFKSKIVLSLKQPLGIMHNKIFMTMEQTLENNDQRIVEILMNKCNKCEYESLWKNYLRRHVTTHSGEKSIKCDQCIYATSRAGDLRKHMTKHSGEKSNKCKQCNFASSNASNLKTHLKTHSGERPNKCNQCDYGFCQAGDLRKRMKMQ